MKTRAAVALGLAAFVLGTLAGGILAVKGESWIGRAWRGLGSIFQAPPASTDQVEIQLAPAAKTTGREIPWTGAR